MDHALAITLSEQVVHVERTLSEERLGTLLFDLDSAIQQLGAQTPDHPVSLQLTGVYHNLLRRWAEA